MNAAGPDAQRAQMLERWERAAAGWGKRANRVLQLGMPVSTWMIDRLALQPGQRVLELAAGPGDTGFLAAELVRPGGSLISSDAAEAMLELARARATELGIDNVEFRCLDLEWIDLPTASVDAIICRWGLMLSVDPAAALHEARRVLRPGGRLALAVWDDPAANPWSTIPTQALVELGHAEPVDRAAPGMFALAAPGRLQGLVESAGFLDVVTQPIEIERGYPTLQAFLEETRDLSLAYSDVLAALSEAQREEVVSLIGELAAPFTAAEGSVRFPARSLGATANA